MRPEEATTPVSHDAPTPPSGVSVPAGGHPGAPMSVPATAFPVIAQPQPSAPPAPPSRSAPKPPVEFLNALPETLLPLADTALGQPSERVTGPASPAKRSVPVAPAKTVAPASPPKPLAPVVPAKPLAPVVPAKVAVPSAPAKAPAQAAPIQSPTPPELRPRLVKSPSPVSTSDVKKQTAAVSLAAVAPAPPNGSKVGGVKPSLWHRLTATPLNTMLLIAFPLALLSLTLAVVALFHQVGGTASGPEVVALNSPSATPTKSPSISPSASPSATPSEPDQSVAVPPPVDLPPFESAAPVPTPFDLLSQEPVPTPTPSPSLPVPSTTPNAQTYTPWVYTPQPSTPTPTRPVVSTAPTAASPGQVPVLVVDNPPVTVTSTDTGKGSQRDRLVPVISGTAAAGAEIRVGFIAADGYTEAKAKADSKGRWTVGPLAAVGLDTTTIEVYGTALNGDESWTFTTVNLAGPSVLISPKGNQTFSARVTDRPGTVFEILLNGEPLVGQQTIGAAGTWESMLPTLKPGNHQVGVRIVSESRPGPVISTLVRVF